MPSVEMRRSTRVFVPKAKDGELVRVLRSGRRLWVETVEVKHRGIKNGDELFPLIDSGKCKQQNGWRDVGPKPEAAADPMDVDDKKPVPEPVNRVLRFIDHNISADRMFRNVYSRKRKRWNVKNPGVLVDSSDCVKDKGQKKFGLHFVRRQRRRTSPSSAGLKATNWRRGIDQVHDEGIGVFGDNGSLSIVVESSCSGCSAVSSLLICLLRHMTGRKVRLVELKEFMLSTPISPVFASCGIRFSWNDPCIKSRGLCSIFGARHYIPLFTVDFSAVPLCFLQLHTTMLFRSMRWSMRLPCLYLTVFHMKHKTVDEETLICISDQTDQSPSSVIALNKNDAKDMKPVTPASGVGKSVNHNVQYRYGVTTRSGLKRRRRSLRTRRARNPSLIVLQKACGPSVSDHVSLKKKASQLAIRPNQELRRSLRKSSASEISVPKSSPLSLNVDIDSQCCSANILVVENDKCFRVDGAEVVLDVSASNEWILAAKKDGSTRYYLKTQREMKPGTTNRFTHAVIWAGENGWKLEFPERKDWLVFKELYKLCGVRNVVPTSPVVKVIPVPGVHEVPDSWDSCSSPFVRPDSYIKMASDELSRYVSRRTANYDMDSEDEEWLSKFNNEMDSGTLVTQETFELIIDAFEKDSFFNPEAYSDEKAAANLCQDLTTSEVAEPVYRYWMKKRKQKGAPLMMIFQLNQPDRAHLISKPVLRKKRSLKRQALSSLQRGRGKDSSVFQAIAAEQSAVEEKSATLRVEEATASASRSMEVAIAKRQRAQFLMENADLAFYRATMALRIADAAKITDSHQAAAHFLD